MSSQDPPLRSPKNNVAVALVGLALLLPATAAGAPAEPTASAGETAPTSATLTTSTPTTASATETTTTATATPDLTAPSTAEPSPPAPTASGGLLGPSEAEETPPAEFRPPPPSLDDGDLSDSQREAQAAYFQNLYRPPNNPGRFNAVLRTTYTILGSNDHHLSGRFFGVSADIGQSWNTMGYALSLHANFGELKLREDGSVWTPVMIGAGPSVDLGRLALLQRGYLDLRVGYDFYYAPGRSRDPVNVDPFSITPHGPRLQLNMGLLGNPARQRRFFHGIGATVGYQALVGSFSGDLPFTSVLLFGLSYYVG
ncbi:MAG: hypothetical protein H6710_10410 [Myxococcales bacterium]|nr:hypothetical protein [Myxococcales bacterium]